MMKNLNLLYRRGSIVRAAAGLLLFAGAALMLVSCDGFPPGGGEEEAEAEAQAREEEEEESVFAVNTTKAQSGVMENYIEVNGDVVTRTSVETYPDNAGKLSKLNVDLGDRVRKDQEIAEVDPSRPGSQFEPSPVKAPISGTIIELPAQVGSTVSSQMSIAQISKMDDLQIRTAVAERFIGSMKLGLRAVISTEAFPEREYEGRVSKLSPVVDPQSRMMEVKIDLPGSSEGLKVGMFVEVKLITERKENALQIPVECVTDRSEDTYVFVVDDSSTETGTVSRRRITTGIQVDGQVEVLEGLEEGEEVVTEGQTLLEDGAKVRIISREEQE